MRLTAIAAIIASICAAAPPAAADPVINRPVYNPDTKSYFELFTPDPQRVANGLNIDKLNWRTANALAATKFHKGVRGRLAVVKDEKVHEFLKETFQPPMPAWIGLRFWCRFNKAQWVTGEVLNKSDFSKWGPIWNEFAVDPRDNPEKKRASCISNDSREHFGVHYWSITQGFHWNAQSRDKGFPLMFVEYPTGAP